MKSDSEIKQDVENELRWDPDIDPTDIAVTVNRGIVTLAGFVRSYSHKREAEGAAKCVAGVVGVANDIEVRVPGSAERPDPEIAREAVSAIKTRLPGYWEQVKVVVKNGSVTLEGELESNFLRQRAENAVLWLKGVKGVTNLIKFKSRVSPSDVKRKIEEAFRRSAEIDANHVKVETTGGTVTLKGTVRSWSEREAAASAAWAAPGVTMVQN